MERYTNNLSELNKTSLPDAGGKGANLGELIHAGLPVPPGFVVTTGAYHAHLDESGLRERIAKRLESINGQDMTAIAKASGDISSWVEEAPMPICIMEEVSRAFESLSEETRQHTKLQVAVRSSATAEDLPSASFAGQHDTFLGVIGQESVLNYVKKCWVSLWTPEAMSYRISMNFEHLEVELAVVVQAMIASEAAGVMFTANPVNGNREEILISAGYGLGETVVGGLINPDNFILTKSGGVKEKILGSKEKRIMLTAGGTVTEAVSTAKQNAFCIGG
jgi:pyruvate,water dikinase